jgi:hypothetical protein
LVDFFDNGDIAENAATLTLNVPLVDNFTVTPPSLAFTNFKIDINNIKAAGVKVVATSVNPNYFCFGDINGNVGAGFAGFAGLDSRANLIGGGQFVSL